MIVSSSNTEDIIMVPNGAISNTEDFTMVPNGEIFTNGQLWESLLKLAKKNNEMEEALIETKNLCNIIVDSLPDTTIKGEIESLAFELANHLDVINSQNEKKFYRLDKGIDDLVDETLKG